MALDAEIEALASRSHVEKNRKLLERARNIGRAKTIRSYRALFLNPDGSLKPEAIAVIADFSRAAQLGRVVPAAASDGEVREFGGRRMLALHIIERIDLSGEKLRVLATKLREHGE